MKKNEHALAASDLLRVPCFRPSVIYSCKATFSGGVNLYTEVFFMVCPGIRLILWSHGWCFSSHCASSSEKTFAYFRNSRGISLDLTCSFLARLVDTVVRATMGLSRWFRLCSDGLELCHKVGL